MIRDGRRATAATLSSNLVEPLRRERLVASPRAQPMEMRGRPMRGWLRVAREDLGTAAALGRWVSIGREYARSLPPKG